MAIFIFIKVAKKLLGQNLQIVSKIIHELIKNEAKKEMSDFLEKKSNLLKNQKWV